MLKIKKLTLEQAEKLCRKYLKQVNGLWQCDKCPYGVRDSYNCRCKLDFNYLDEFGDEEVKQDEKLD